MLTIGEQVYGLSLIWSEAKYNFAFWNARKALDWDGEYREALRRVMRPMELIDYYLELMRFLSLLNDGHTHIDLPPEISREIRALPIRIKWMSGRHVVANVARGCEIPPFCEILAIDGAPFDRYMAERVLPYCWNIKPSSAYELLYTFHWLPGNADRNAYTLIPIVEGNREIELLTTGGAFAVKPVGRQIDWALPTALRCGEELTEVFQSEGLRVHRTRDGIAVIALPTFMDDGMPGDFYGLLDELKACAGFVVDVRDNGGGHSNNADAFSQAFLKGAFQTGKVRHAVHIGAYKAWGYGNDFSDWDLSDPWKKKVYDVCNRNLFEEEIVTAFYPDCPLTLDQPAVILENAATGSSAENLLINFDAAGRATIVGAPSYGTTGNPLMIDLPGGGRARICTRRYTYPDDTEFINIGIQPHVRAELTRGDLMSGHDGVLDRGLEVLRERLREEACT